jgi:hypothetical protein
VFVAQQNGCYAFLVLGCKAVVKLSISIRRFTQQIIMLRTPISAVLVFQRDVVEEKSRDRGIRVRFGRDNLD